MRPPRNQSAPHAHHRETPAWWIAVRIVVLMAMLLTFVWLVKNNSFNPDQDAHPGDEKISSERNP